MCVMRIFTSELNVRNKMKGINIKTPVIKRGLNPEGPSINRPSRKR
jgi:hypothetical protein